MHVPTVVLLHKKKGTKLIVNQSEYATDLGKEKYKAYELFTERHTEDTKANEVTAPEKEAPVETGAKLEQTPKEPAKEEPPKPRSNRARPRNA